MSAPTTNHAPTTTTTTTGDAEAGPAKALEAAATRALDAYAGDAAEQIPVGGYAAMLAVFLGSFTTLALAARGAGALPRRVPVQDIALLGVATHKLARIVSRERVTIPLRIPFTHYQGSDGAGQVREEPRGRGIQRAIGGLITCQYCAGPWIATALTAGLLFAPRITRLASAVFAMVTVSDFLHQAYAGSRRWSGTGPGR